MSMRLPRFAAVLSVVLVTACRNPQADTIMAEQMRDLADELNAARQETAAIHEQVDSLRLALARQDTLLRQIANLAGMPVR